MVKRILSLLLLYINSCRRYKIHIQAIFLRIRPCCHSCLVMNMIKVLHLTVNFTQSLVSLLVPVVVGRGVMEVTLSWTIVSRSHTFSSHSITLAPACQKPFKVYEFWSCDRGSADAKDVSVAYYPASSSSEVALMWFCITVSMTLEADWAYCL